MRVRLLRPEDRDEWLRLRKALWPDIADEEQHQEMADLDRDAANQPVFVAQADDASARLCGLIEVSIRTSAPGCVTDRIGYLEAWYIDPEWRGRGVGRLLAEAAEAWARERGCTEMASDTTPDYPASPAAHAALGYQEVERCFRKVLT